MLKSAYPYYLANQAYANQDLAITNKYRVWPILLPISKPVWSGYKAITTKNAN